MLFVTIVLILIFSATLSGFATIGNFLNLGRSVAVLGLLGLGMGIVVIGRGLDLSTGIHVIQVNMVSSYKTDAYVGADWIQIGRMVGEEVVKACGKDSGTSHKVAVVQGDLTSAASIEQMQGFKDAVSQDATIQIVSDQAADWDATKANNVTATVLQQHPDLCATFGFWGTMQNGAAQAVKAAGKLGQVKVYASGEGNRFDCDNVRDGLFTKFLNYEAPQQAHTIMNTASFLLQSGLKPGDVRMAMYSRPTWITKENFNPAVCFDPPKS